MKKYVLGIDQSTQGTKGIIFDGSGKIIARTDLAHDQIINEKGWVEHNPDQIMKNVIQVVKNVVEKAGIDKEEILTLGISNQRETAVCWNKNTGRPVYNAIVWQCARGEATCNKIAEDGYAQMVQEHSGIPLSPYYSAAKIAWVLQNVPEAKEAADKEEVLTVTFHRNTEEAPEVTLKYFAYDDTYDSLEINGTERFLVKAEDVDALVKQIKKAF